jgi:transcription elongation factor Elf1
MSLLLMEGETMNAFDKCGCPVCMVLKKHIDEEFKCPECKNPARLVDAVLALPDYNLIVYCDICKEPFPIERSQRHDYH